MMLNDDGDDNDEGDAVDNASCDNSCKDESNEEIVANIRWSFGNTNRSISFQSTRCMTGATLKQIGET